jgi:hypothetical protein
VAITVGCAVGGRLPWLGVAPSVVLLVRSISGLAAGRRRVRPQVLGAAEVALGAMTVFVLALAYAIGNPGS